MTPAQAIRAGGLSLTRNRLRELALGKGLVRMVFRTPTGDQYLDLDAPAARAAIEGADLNISDRLLKLGVSEHEHVALPPPDPERPSGPGGPHRGGNPRPDGVPKPPLEPA